MSKKSRKRNNRRDRRLAKQSGWTRPGKSNPKKVGHGGSGMNVSYSRMFGLLNIKKEPEESEENNNTLKFRMVINGESKN